MDLPKLCPSGFEPLCDLANSFSTKYCNNLTNIKTARQQDSDTEPLVQKPDIETLMPWTHAWTSGIEHLCEFLEGK